MISYVLPAGSIIYRAHNTEDPSAYLNANYCEDTGKTGLYFSDKKKLCMGMGVENGVDIALCTYRVKQSIVLYEGKYSFRNINPDRYFRDGRFLCDTDVISEENISHFDQSAIPVFDGAERIYGGQSGEFLGEIFICDRELENLMLLDVEEIQLERICEALT